MKTKKDGTISKQGENGGRPPIFKNEREFLSAIEEYLANCETKKKMPNVAGFAAFNKIGRERYYDYAKKYPHIKRQFEAFVESEWVDRLAGTSATGAIFYLKNAFREFYKDRTETDITSGGKKIQPILGGLSKKKD